MLINLFKKNLISIAKKNRCAIGAFNINSFECIKFILEASKKKKKSVIIQVSINAAKSMGGFKIIKNIFDSLINSMKIDIPVWLHLDHGDYESVLECIELGYDSVMFDGSKMTFDENCKKTLEIVKKAHFKKIFVECEVGIIKKNIYNREELSDILQCKKIVELGIDFLACSIGNVHGNYPKNWKSINFFHLKKIINLIGKNIPIVLHGGSGIPKEQIKKLIFLGVSKININTSIKKMYFKSILNYIDNYKKLNFRNLFLICRKNIIKLIENYIELFYNLK